MRRFVYLSLALALAAPFASQASELSGSPKSVLLATVPAGPDFMPHDIPVDNCATSIQQIKIIVQDNSVYMQDIAVVFADNSSHSIPMFRTFDVGYQSPWIDLGIFRPAGSCVSKLVVEGNAGDDLADAHVQVWGIVN
jgi:hypothetical protein